MSHRGQENQGTGLRDVFDIIVKAPPQRLLSLTFQLGESPEDNIIHALCLIVLHKEVRALNKLQTLKDNYLANYLAEKWQTSGGNLEDFGVHCGNFQELTEESLAVLARIYKILTEQRLCDPLLRNLAYKRALSSDNQRTRHCEDLKYDQLREEAKVVCGPQFAEWMCSSTDLKSGHDPHSSLNEGNTTFTQLSLSQDQSERAHSLPSPLQASSSVPSYPSHLEISMPPTALFQDDKIMNPETSDKSKLIAPVTPVSERAAKNTSGQSQTSEEPQPKCNEPLLLGAKKHSKMDETLAAESRKLVCLIADTQDQTTKPTAEPKFALPTATNIVQPKMRVTNEMPESIGAEGEDEATFYAFVILHAPEDADMAESMRDKLEKVIDGEGATFSEEFEVPGKSTLVCVEDAINNSAFTFLLLTRNFNTRMLEVKTDFALHNSINKAHKYNTVIPLLPRDNRMLSLPGLLQTIIPLEENENFERKIKKVLAPAKIKKQKTIWTEERKLKMQMERQERLKRLTQHQKQLITEYKTAQLLEKEILGLSVEQTHLLNDCVPPQQEGGAWLQQQHPNIHINNANYIVIGNNSQMAVDRGGGPDDAIYREEGQ